MRTIITYITALIALLAFSSCEDENRLPSDEIHYAYIHAEVTGQYEATSRGLIAEVDEKNGTYKAFTSGNEVGIYALGPLYDKTVSDNALVRNLKFTLGNNGRWQDTPQLIWNNNTGDAEVDNLSHADIYGYYPYQSHGKNVFKEGGSNHPIYWKMS